ncbi:extracellular solute-binding protein [Amycolatopsis mediterranei]|uniref:extracellular solute-binding protein n=1 Tax=Amycolatopsis mediterranei TaxID=33910 RepID=UPI0004103056|nr:extracellular solute-binding protein [Amycolatopsis mediterranei]
MYRSGSSSCRGRVAVALVAAGALVLSGCGRSSESTGTADAGPAVDNSPATGDVTIWAAQNEGKTLSALAKSFTAENPGVRITVTPVSFDELPRKVDTAVASGQVPDIIQPSTGLQSFVATGGIAPVPDGVTDPKDFFEPAVSAVTFHGIRYAVPWYVTVQSFYYRADLAKKAGVEAPKTWDDTIKFGKALKNAGARHGALIYTKGTAAWQTVLPLIYEAGGTVLKDGKFTFDTPEVITALDHYQSFFREGVADPTVTISTAGETEAGFADGTFGSYLTGSFSYGLALSALHGDTAKLGLATLPAGPKSGAGYLGGSGLAVMASAHNKDAAWKFVRYATSAQGEQKAYEISGVLPAARTAWKSGPLAESAVGKTFASQIENSLPQPQVLTWTEVRDAIARYAEQLARGVISPKDAATRLQAEAEKIGTGER